MDPTEEVQLLTKRLEEWAASDVKSVVDSSVREMRDDYVRAIKAGQNGDGSLMKSLKDSTMMNKVRRQSNEAQRAIYGLNPLSATGATAESLEVTRPSDEEWEISSSTDLGDAILASNAASTHSGSPFYGDTPKAVRDPLRVFNKQVDLLEKNLFDDLERVIS